VLRALHVNALSLREAPAADTPTGGVDVYPGVTMYRLPRGVDAAARVAHLSAAYTHVLVVTGGPPTSDICAIAQSAQRVLVCAERQRTRVGDLLATVRQFRLVRARITGSLLVGATRGLAVLGTR
jgi:hypothetical protein